MSLNAWLSSRMPPSRLRSASRLWGGTRPCGSETTLAGWLTRAILSDDPDMQAKGRTIPWQNALVEHKTCYPVNSCGVPVTDDDKPKRSKSWREIDKMRDRGGSTRRDSRERERFESSTGYTK